MARPLMLACLLVVGCSGSKPTEETADDASETETAPDPRDSTAQGDSDEPTDTAIADAAPDDSGSDAKADADPAPSCPAAAPCPGIPTGLGEGNGPMAIDQCAFSLQPDAKSYEAPITALGSSLMKVSIAGVLNDLNRTAPAITAAQLPGVPGFQRGFVWDDDDNGKVWWIPQGITGTPDAYATGTIGGKKAIVVTWYYELAKHPGSTGEKGTRISIADVSTAAVKYRHLLLVEPTMNGTRADFAPINIHAGGVVWIGDRLFVADTGSGIRVFDLSRIFEVSAATDSVGWDGAAYQGGLYKYVVPQVGFYRDTSQCNPVFSFVALDRSTTPPALLTGEYVADGIQGRLFRWPVDATTGAIEPKTWADGAWAMAQRQVQGALTHNGVFYMSSSQPAAGKGVLYVTRPGKKSLSYAWVDAPEDLMFDEQANALWSAGEAVNKRYVFAASATALKAP